MKIQIKQITTQGLEVHQTVEPTEIGLEKEEIQLVSPLKVDARIEKAGEAILASGSVEAKYAFPCVRCLEVVESIQRHHFQFDYVLADVHDVVDLGEDIRQEMIMNLPSRVLCKEDCRGICLKCGVNLNKEECRCK